MARLNQTMKIRYFLEAIDRELFWESLQDHWWKPRGDVLVSPDDQNISIAKNRQMYYRGVSTRTKYSDRSYRLLLRFEQNEAKRCKKSPDLLTFASEALQLAAVRQEWHAIQRIRHPSEITQLAAVHQNGWAIGFIQNPSEAVQLAAVRQNGWAIQYIKNPSEAVQLAAVQEDGLAIRYIEDPSEAVQLTAVEENGWAIEYIEDPSEALQLAAVQQDWRTIDCIENPSEEVVKRAAIASRQK